MAGVDDDPTSFQAYVAFTTTHAAEAPFPEPTLLHAVRCKIQRADPAGGVPTAAGLYYLITTEDIGGTLGESVDYRCKVEGEAPGGVINLLKIRPFVWQVQLFDVIGGGAGILTLDDLMNGNTGSTVTIGLRRIDRA